MIKLKVKHLIVIAGVVSTGICVSNTNVYAKTLGENVKPTQIESVKIEKTTNNNVSSKEKNEVNLNSNLLSEKINEETLSTKKSETKIKNNSINKNEKVKIKKNKDENNLTHKTEVKNNSDEEINKTETFKDRENLTNKIEIANTSETQNSLTDNIENKNNLPEKVEDKKDLTDKTEVKNNLHEIPTGVETKNETTNKTDAKNDLNKEIEDAKSVKEKEELNKITVNGTTITGDSENGITINVANNPIGNHVYHITNSYNGTTVMLLNIANDLSYTAHNIYTTYCDTYDTAVEVYEARGDIKETVEDLATVAEAVKIIPKDSVETLTDLKDVLSENKQETLKGIAKLGAKTVVNAVVCGGTVATVDKMISTINQIDTVKDEPHSVLSPVTKKINHACDVIRTKMYSVRVAVKTSKAYIKTKHTLVSIKSTVSNWFNW